MHFSSMSQRAIWCQVGTENRIAVLAMRGRACDSSCNVTVYRCVASMIRYALCCLNLLAYSVF